MTRKTENLKKCGYCKKAITKKHTYGRLPSGILIHDEQGGSCYNKAFRTERKTFRGRMFNLKNDILCNYDKFLFFLMLLSEDLKNLFKNTK